MASVEFEGPAGGGTLAKPAGKKDKYGFEGPVAASEGQAGPDMSQLEAAGRGGIHGAMLGLEGYLAAAGLGEAAGLTGQDYGSPEQILKEQRRTAAERIAEARAAHPYTTGAAEFAGGMVSPIPIPRGATLPARMGIGALTGGAIGGVSSFGGAENPTVPQFLLSTGAGTVAGGALPAVTGALSVAGRAAAERMGLDRLPWFRDVEREAAVRVNTAREQAQLVEREARARAAVEGIPYEPQTLSPARLGPGQPGMAIDVLGRPGNELARSAANQSPVARATLEGPLYQRRTGQLERAEAELTPTLDRPMAGQQREALARPSPEVNQAYRVAREIGDGRIELTEPLQTLAQTRVVQAAYRRIQTDMEDAHRLDTLQRQAQGLPPRNAPSGNDLATWDLVKRRLDDMYRQAQRAGNYTRANLVSDAARTLRTELDRQVPEYGQARTAARAEILARNAFEEGRQFLTKGDIYETQQALQALQQTSPQAIHEFQQGYTHAMLERMRSKATAGNLYAQVKETPDQTARMTVALGLGRTMQQQRQRREEEIMQRGLEGTVGNSTTARQLANLGIAAGGGALVGGAAGLTAEDLFGIGHSMTAMGLGAAIPIVSRALTRQPGLNVDIQVANRIAQMLVSRDPRQLLALANLAAERPPLRAALDLVRDNVVAPALTRGVAGAGARAVAP